MGLPMDLDMPNVGGDMDVDFNFGDPMLMSSRAATPLLWGQPPATPRKRKASAFFVLSS